MDSETREIFGAAIEASGLDAGLPSRSVSSDSHVNGDELPEGSSVPTTTPLVRLAQFVIDSFRTNAEHRRNSGVDRKLKDALLAQTCRYTPEQVEKMRRAGIDPRVFSPITSTKVLAAKSMLVDIFNSSGEWPFTLSPTPDPDIADSVVDQLKSESESRISELFMRLQQMGVQNLPPDVMSNLRRLIVAWVNGRYDEIMNRKESYAKVRAKRMERKVQDMMTEGGWHKAFYEYVDHICIYGTGLIIGPVPRVVPVNKCRENRRTGTVRYTREYKTIPTYEAVNPTDCYPAPDAKDASDGTLCIRVKYMPNELASYVSANAGKENSDTASGWMVGTLRALVARWPHGGCKVLEERKDNEIRQAEKNGTDDSKDCTMEGIRCFSSVIGRDLIEFGITKTQDGRKISARDFYSTETIVIDGYVVYCRIIDDRLGRPVSKGVFYELPGSWWGESVADKLYMVQSVMNNCIKSLMQNMSVASGPMYWINDVSRLSDKSTDGLRPRPHKIYGFTQSYGAPGSGAPMGVISIPSNASELLSVWERMKQQADDDSLIPAYSYGQSSGQGALRTASGLAILTEAYSRGMKMVVGTTDRLVTRDQVIKTCNWILLYDDDIDLKGDCEVNPSGVMGKILKAQQDQQRLQFLNMAITNPILNQIFGHKGIVALLRPSISDLAINPDDCLPSEERLKELELVEQIQQVFQATQAKSGVQEAILNQQAQQQGAVPGVEQPPKIQGGVEERRGAA